MISSEIISIILWVPFAVIFLFAALIFCLSGYKRGLWRALISLGITVVSAVISFFLSKFIAGIVTASVVNMVLGLLPTGNPLVSIAKTLLPSFVQAMLAVLFFSGIFFIVTLIGKIIGNVVKKDALRATDEQVGLKWGGLGVRVADAIIYSVLLMLPLYGTLGTYAPTVQTLLKLGGEETSAYAGLLGAVADHPLVGATNNTIIGNVYDGLADGTGGPAVEGSVNVNVNEVVDAMDTTMVKFEAISSATNAEEKEAACLELVTHLKENVVDADWSYDVIKETTTVLKDEIVNSMEGAKPEDIKKVETVVGMLDMSKEEFQENSGVMLDFAEYALKNDVMTDLEKGDMTNLKTEEFYEEAATFLNATAQTSEIKKYLITETITEVFLGDAETANKVMNSYDDSAITTPEAQKQEIEALINISEAKNAEELKEALKNVPTLDNDALEEAFKNFGK